MTAARLILRSGPLRLELAPGIGGAIAAFDVKARDGRSLPLLRRAPEVLEDPLQAAAFPLVPFSNRIRDGAFHFRGREVRLSPDLPGQKHPLHGQGWRHPWSVRFADRDRAELDFVHAAGEWPWRYAARQSFRLDGGGLSYVIQVRNESPEPMPAGLGVHPYFPCDAATRLSTRASLVWTVDAEVMPILARPATGRYALSERRICGQDLDNGYAGWSGRARIRWPGSGLALEMAAPGAGYFQLYSPTAGGLFVAEPVTHANDALTLPEAEAVRLGVRVLEPGRSMALAVRFAVIA